ncbi:hypothetical protein V1279_003554 [Bradyrhizobium sp. AZCC 1610]
MSLANSRQRRLIEFIEAGWPCDFAVQETPGRIDRERDEGLPDFMSRYRAWRILLLLLDLRANRQAVFHLRGSLGMGRNPATDENENYKTDAKHCLPFAAPSAPWMTCLETPARLSRYSYQTISLSIPTWQALITVWCIRLAFLPQIVFHGRDDIAEAISLRASLT